MSTETSKIIKRIYVCDACESLDEPCMVVVWSKLSNVFEKQREPNSCIYGPDTEGKVLEPNWRVSKSLTTKEEIEPWYNGGREDV